MTTPLTKSCWLALSVARVEWTEGDEEFCLRGHEYCRGMLTKLEFRVHARRQSGEVVRRIITDHEAAALIEKHLADWLVGAGAQVNINSTQTWIRLRNGKEFVGPDRIRVIIAAVIAAKEQSCSATAT